MLPGRSVWMFFVTDLQNQNQTDSPHRVRTRTVCRWRGEGAQRYGHVGVKITAEWRGAVPTSGLGVVQANIKPKSEEDIASRQGTRSVAIAATI
jgi:hypothetical protein